MFNRSSFTRFRKDFPNLSITMGVEIGAVPNTALRLVRKSKGRTKRKAIKKYRMKTVESLVTKSMKNLDMIKFKRKMCLIEI